MYCPSCGLAQSRRDLRFCSGCGFQLSAVSGLLSTNGIPSVPDMPFSSPPKPIQSPRKQGVRQGAKLMFLSLVTLPVIIGLSIVVDGPGFLIIPFTIFLAGLAWMIYSAIFGEDYAAAPPATSFRQPHMNAQHLPAPPRHFNTPHAEGHRITTTPRIDTSEMTQPPSVTESTTKLFENEQN